MPEKSHITDRQGDWVLVVRPPKPDRLFQIRNAVHPDRQELHLVYRSSGSAKRVDWVLTPQLEALLKPAPAGHPYRWELRA